MTNLNDKQRVLSLQLHLVERLASHSIFLSSVSSLCSPSDANYSKHYSAIDEYARLSHLHGYDWHIAHNINKAYYSRVARLKRSITTIVASGSAYFLTLTFNDYALTNSLPGSRRQNVYRYLKSISVDYVANVDYGDDKGREHYHAVLSLPHGKTSIKWCYGFFKVIKIGKQESDIVKLSKYISKLTNHALKETARNKRIIYSRDNERQRLHVSIQH